MYKNEKLEAEEFAEHKNILILFEKFNFIWIFANLGSFTRFVLR